MQSVSVIHFAAVLIIVGTIFRLIETKWPDTVVGRALAFVY